MRTLLGLLLASVVIVGSGCATADKMEGKNEPPPSVNVTGNWAGNWTYERQNLGGGTVSGNLVQDGAKLTGQLTVIGTGGSVNNVIGYVTGNTVKFTYPVIGNFTVNSAGNEMTGMVQGLDTARATLKKQ